MLPVFVDIDGGVHEVDEASELVAERLHGVGPYALIVLEKLSEKAAELTRCRIGRGTRVRLDEALRAPWTAR